jgi:hypothetical protein
MVEPDSLILAQLRKIDEKLALVVDDVSSHLLKMVRPVFIAVLTASTFGSIVIERRLDVSADPFL